MERERSRASYSIKTLPNPVGLSLPNTFLLLMRRKKLKYATGINVNPRIDVGTASQKAASLQTNGPSTPMPARYAPPKKQGLCVVSLKLHK